MTIKRYFDRKIWADDVKCKDSKRCIICGSQKELEAHHVFGVNQYPYLTMEINNGITLCRTCHRKYHEKYNDINARTWTEFILENPFKVTNIEINYKNGFKKNVSLYYDGNEFKPLLNNDLRGTILHEIQMSGFDNGIVPTEWLLFQINNKYGMSNQKIINELNNLINRGLIEQLANNNLKINL